MTPSAMKVILQKDVPNLGDAGDVKDVADGFARNYLLPRKLVVPAVGNSTKALEHHKKVIARKQAKRHQEMSGLAEKLKALGSVEIAVRVGQKKKLYGSVTPMDVARALTEKGFTIEKRKIEVTDPIRVLGNHKVRVRLAEKILVPLSVTVVPDKNQPVEEEMPEPTAAEMAAAESAAGAENAAVAEASDSTEETAAE